MSKLCYDRNYKSIFILENYYSFELIFKIIQDVNIPYLVKAKFTDLFLNLHLDKEPFEKLVIPNYTRIYNEIFKSLNEFPCFSSAISPE